VQIVIVVVVVVVVDIVAYLLKVCSKKITSILWILCRNSNLQIMVGRKLEFLQHFWSVSEVINVTYDYNIVLRHENGLLRWFCCISVALDSC